MSDIYMDVDIALASVPVNKVQLIDDTDFKAIEAAVVYNQAGLALFWNFTTTAGVTTVTAITPTTAGDYDWTDFTTSGFYGIEIPASGGASINNDTEGFGYFSGVATGILPWIGPTITFRAVALNNAMIDGGDNLDVNVIEVSGDSDAADNLELQYDGTGIVGDTFPATQASVSNIANVGSAVAKAPSSYTLTTGTQSSGTVSSTAALDGTNHEHTDVAGVMDLYYEFNIGSGTPSSVTVTGYLNGNNDDLEVYGYDWVAAGWVQIGVLAGKVASTNEVNSYELFVAMVGSGANEGKVRVRFTDGAFTLTTATLAIDQIFCSFSQGAGGYENGSVWLDPGASNTNTEVGIDGVSGNPVSTIAAVTTLLASTNLHRVQVAPSTTTVTLEASHTDEVWVGRDWILALGGRDITGSFLFGATVSGVSTATAKYRFEECDLGAVTMDNDGHFEQCALGGIFTVGQAGTFTFHNCYTESASAITIDFGVLGATAIHLFEFDGEVNFKNMAVGDTVHITGAGTISTENCTAGTIDHDGFFEYTDSGGNVTEQQSDIKVAVDAIKVPTDKLVFTVANEVDSNILSINGVNAAAVRLALSAGTMVIGTVDDTVAPTLTTFECDDITEATADHFIGRVVIFTSGALINQATDITDYELNGGKGKFTVTALTEAPANNVTLIIV